jgi:hypothetical protein
MILRNRYKSKYSGFTLIEIIIYCSIFIIFAVVAIESMIWMSGGLSMLDSRSLIDNGNIYKIYYSNMYKRYRINNQKIEDRFSDLIASSSIASSTIKEDIDFGVLLNKSEVMYLNRNKKEQLDVLFFDSINNGV